MLWVKAFHIVSVITWFAALFYLPRLFVYHSMTNDTTSIERFKIMERRLYQGIMMPSFIITTLLGSWMIYDYAWQAYSDSYWLQIKLALVLVLVVYHFYCGHLVNVFEKDKNTRPDRFYRWFNEIPVLFLVGIIVLVIQQPRLWGTP